MKKCFAWTSGLIFCAAIACADDVATTLPTVSDVTIEQHAASRRVTIQYKLSHAPGIVTVDILTNAVSIGDANLTHFAGDVNRLVQPGEDLKTVYWYPDKAWPGFKVDDAVARVTAWATNAPPDYMVLDLLDGRQTYYTSTNCLPDGGLANDVYRIDRIVFRKIPARGVTWRMGSPTDELGRADDETPHLVTLEKDYWFGIYPVTIGQYNRWYNKDMNTVPSFCYFTNTTCHLTRPLHGVGMKSLRSWELNFWPESGHAVDRGTHLSHLRARVNNLPLDLPTEAQWEYAARAGAGTALTTGQNLFAATIDAQLNVLGRYWRNCIVEDDTSTTAVAREADDTKGLSKVGVYLPNRWGIYDVHGNVAEFCLDRYGAYVGDMESVQRNPQGALTGSSHVARGGFWGYTANEGAAKCRLASRRSFQANSDTLANNRHMGYRLCLEID